MGSISDIDIVKKTVKVLDDFQVGSEVRVISAHRTPFEAIEFAKNADK
ncbi:AIR carboxylase family protein, partial [Anaerosalibacter bizertensis]|nr:AIR carboxylase family protein [Anaerosalibacter bizertensis]